MSFFLLGGTEVAEEEEPRVEVQAAVVGNPDDTADLKSAPSFNDARVYLNRTSGLQPSTIGGDVVDFGPVSKDYTITAGQDYDSNVNRRISSAGYTASREELGEGGRRSLRVVTSIEPTIRDGSKFGNDYFAAMDDGLKGSVVDTAIAPQNVNTNAVYRNSVVGRRASRAAYVQGGGVFLDPSALSSN